VGIAAKIKAAGDEVVKWAKSTPFRDILVAARDAYDPGNPWFSNETKMISDLTLATLFAGLVGTTDMTLKCVKYQLGHSRLGKTTPSQTSLFEQDPEKYLIELMRYDSAVTSVTEALGENRPMILEGRRMNLKEGTPMQLVLATANRDPSYWSNPDGFDPIRAQLAETLSWNGRVASVEARSFSEAPRHCPGHCLSLKVSTSICAGMMGSFEKLVAEGKLLKNDGKVQCNNFNPDLVEPPLWEPPR